VKLKPYIQRSDGSAKGDWDVGIAIDIMDAALDPKNGIDLVVLLSGDGDFDLLLKRIVRSGNTETRVYGAPELTAKSLIDAATQFYPINASLLLGYRKSV